MYVKTKRAQVRWGAVSICNGLRKDRGEDEIEERKKKKTCSRPSRTRSIRWPLEILRRHLRLQIARHLTGFLRIHLYHLQLLFVASTRQRFEGSIHALEGLHLDVDAVSGGPGLGANDWTAVLRAEGKAGHVGSVAADILSVRVILGLKETYAKSSGLEEEKFARRRTARQATILMAGQWLII